MLYQRCARCSTRDVQGALPEMYKVLYQRCARCSTRDVQGALPEMYKILYQRCARCSTRDVQGALPEMCKVSCGEQSYLEVDDNSKDKHSSHQVGEIREVLTLKSFSQPSNFIRTSGKNMEKRYNCSFKLST